MVNIRDHGLSRNSPIQELAAQVPTERHETGASGPVYQARLEPAGSCFEAPANMPLLEAAELAGMAGAIMASSCRNGTCRTCICQLLQGSVSYRIDWPGLSAGEKREGYVLPCVAYPACDVVLQVPQ